jgi:uncharacterized protein (TIGR02996 family)
MSDTRTALEAALVANPEDLAAHAAYADLLIEQDDPRGEYIRLLLAASDSALSPDERERLTAAADELWATHWISWLGPLSPFADNLLPLAWHYCWLRGVQTAILTPEFIAGAECSPFLDTLVVRPDDPADVGDPGIERLVGSRLLSRLSSLELLACGITDDGAEALARCPDVARLEHLRLDDNLLSPIGIDALAAIGHRDVGPQAFVPTDRPVPFGDE